MKRLSKRSAQRRPDAVRQEGLWADVRFLPSFLRAADSSCQVAIWVTQQVCFRFARYGLSVPRDVEGPFAPPPPVSIATFKI